MANYYDDVAKEMTTKAAEKRKTYNTMKIIVITAAGEGKIINHMLRPTFFIMNKLLKKHKNRLIFIER